MQIRTVRQDTVHLDPYTTHRLLSCHCPDQKHRVITDNWDMF